MCIVLNKCGTERVYHKPLHPGVWILQFQHGVKNNAGVSFGSDVLQGLQHTNHLVKYQNAKKNICTQSNHSTDNMSLQRIVESLH